MVFGLTVFKRCHQSVADYVPLDFLTMKKDITELADIERLVRSFYAEVRQDLTLGPIFEAKIQHRWDEHLEKMVRFWQTVLLDQHTYSGSPFAPHANLPVAHAHFEHWMAVFNHTVDALFEGEKAERAKWQGARMAEMFSYKIAYIREHHQTPVL